MKKITILSCYLITLFGFYAGASENEKFVKIAQCNGASIHVRPNYLGSLTQVAVLVEQSDIKKQIKEAIRPFMEEVAKRYGPSALNYEGDDIRFYLSPEKSLTHFQASTMNYGGAPDYSITRSGEQLSLKSSYFSYTFQNCRSIR